MPESLVVLVTDDNTFCGKPPSSNVAFGTGLQKRSAAKATTSTVWPTTNADSDAVVQEPDLPLAQVCPAAIAPALNGTGGVATPSALATGWPFQVTEETTGADAATVEVSLTE